MKKSKMERSHRAPKSIPVKKKKTALQQFAKNFVNSRYLYLMFLPALLYFVVFKYVPMGGITVAFKDYQIFKGLSESPWVGLKHFSTVLSSGNFWRAAKNTLLLNFYNLLWGFPAPIILALLINELRSIRYKKIVQSVTYLPHFISEVVIVGIAMNLLSPTSGIINRVIKSFGGTAINFFAEPAWFRTIYIVMSIWQSAGWAAIIYIAALTNINPALYEAAEVDGASKFMRMIHISIPGIFPTIITILILNVGKLMTTGFEKIILMYSPITYETADVLASFTYRRGIIEGDFSMAAAVGLFESIIGLILILSTNRISRKLNDTSLW